MKSIKTNLLLLLLMMTGFTLSSCKKEQTVESPPSITATSPAENAQLANGQTLNIKGLVTDANGLSSLVIKITDDETNKEIFKTEPKVTDLKSFTIDTPWIISVNDWLTTTLTITATNKQGLKTEKLVHFKIWL